MCNISVSWMTEVGALTVMARSRTPSGALLLLPPTVVTAGCHDLRQADNNDACRNAFLIIVLSSSEVYNIGYHLVFGQMILSSADASEQYRTSVLRPNNRQYCILD